MKKLAFLFLSFVLAGCAHVQSTVTVFSTLPTKAAGETLQIWPADKNKADTLEFKTYADELAKHFQAVGYSVIVGSKENIPKYLAIFNYGIDDGTLITSTFAVPNFGVTGYSGSTTTITAVGSTATANTTYTPQYGVTGYTPVTQTNRIFNRAVLLSIYDVSKLKGTDQASFKAAQVYDGKLTSAGTCSSIAGVMDPMLTALFKDFPGKSGSTNTVNIFGGKC